MEDKQQQQPTREKTRWSLSLDNILTGWFDRMTNTQKASLVLILAFLALIAGLFYLYRVLATIIVI